MIARPILVLVVTGGCRQLFGLDELAEPAATDDASGPGDADAAAADSARDGGDEVGCPATYTLAIPSSTSSYRHVTNQAVPFTSASSRCVADGINTHLIVLSDQAELTEINAATTGSVRWVGLSDRVTDTIYLPVSTETPGFPPDTGPPWASGEPMVSDNDCVSLTADGTLIPISCGNGRNFICECDTFPNDPTHL